MMGRLPALAAVALLAGCLAVGSGEETPVVYYRLSPETSGPGGSVPFTVSLKTFTEDEALDRAEIRYLTSDVEGGYWTDDRWSQSVGAMMQSAVQEDFERSGLFTRVSLLDNAGFADLLLDCRVHRLEEEDRGPDWYGVVEATFELTRARDGTNLYHRRLRMEEKSEGRTVREVVRALNRATARLLTTLKSDLHSSLSGGPR